MIRRLRTCLVVLAAALLGVPILALVAPMAEAQSGESYFVLYGAPGDYITGGSDVFYAESADVAFSPSINFDNGVSVMIDVTDGSAFVERWRVDLAAPNEVPLAPGDAFLATRFPFQAADVAGLSVSGAGRGCNTLTGEFLVRELTIDPIGEVVNFAADFRQSCDGGPDMVGGIRINSTLDNPDRDFTISPPPTGESTFVLYGQPGEYITQGTDISWDDASTGVHFAPSVNFDNGITVMIDVRDAGGAFIESWTANFAAPGDAPLAAGDFTGATRYPFQAADEAGLSVSGDGRGCNTSTGEFRVYELTFDAIGEVETFAVDFRQSCDGDTPVVGGVRVNSEVPVTDPEFVIDPPAPVDTTPPEATADLVRTSRVKRSSAPFAVVASCTDDEPGVALVSADINGVEVAPGQTVTLTISNREKVSTRKGTLTIEAPTITLTVNCADAAGNTAAATAQPAYS